MFLASLLLSNLRRTSRRRMPGNMFKGKMRYWPTAKPWEMQYYHEDAMRELNNIKLLQTPFITHEQEQIYDQHIGNAIRETQKLENLEKLAKKADKPHVYINDVFAHLKMANLSKYQYWPLLEDLTCYEVAHTLEPSCPIAWVKLFGFGVAASFKIYSTLYLISSLFRGDVKSIINYLRTKFLPETLRSTLFLASNSTMFLIFFCIIRFLGGKSFHLQPFIAGTLASYCAIKVEKPSKHSALASYVSMLASECAFASLRNAGVIKGIPRGEILILASALACLSALTPAKPSPDPQHQDTAAFVIKLISSVPSNPKWRESLAKLGSLNCHHKKDEFHSSDISCPAYVADGVIRAGIAGLALDIFTWIRSRGRPAKLKSPATISSNTAIFSLLIFVYRTLLCSSPKLLPKNLSPVLRRSLAAFFAGLTFLLTNQSASIPLWLLFKAAQLICSKIGKFLPAAVQRQAPLLFYAVSTGFLLHESCYEGHNIRPSYWSFLSRVTGNWLLDLNRILLAGFQKGADQIVPYLKNGDKHWWPKYDPAVTHLWSGPTEIPGPVFEQIEINH